MTPAQRPALSRAAALVILTALVGVFCLGPLAAYCAWIGVQDDTLAAQAAMLQRYRSLADAKPAPAGSGIAETALLYPDAPESQTSALLQETVKNAAATARAQVQGMQVLRSEALPGATRIGIRVRATGDMPSLRALIYAIETVRPVLYSDNLQIQAHATMPDGMPSSLDFQLDVSGFKAEPGS